MWLQPRRTDREGAKGQKSVRKWRIKQKGAISMQNDDDADDDAGYTIRCVKGAAKRCNEDQNQWSCINLDGKSNFFSMNFLIRSVPSRTCLFGDAIFSFSVAECRNCSFLHNPIFSVRISLKNLEKHRQKIAKT